MGGLNTNGVGTRSGTALASGNGQLSGPLCTVGVMNVGMSGNAKSGSSGSSGKSGGVSSNGAGVSLVASLTPNTRLAFTRCTATPGLDGDTHAVATIDNPVTARAN